MGFLVQNITNNLGQLTLNVEEIIGSISVPSL